MVIYFHESNSVLQGDFYLFILCCVIEVFLGDGAGEKWKYFVAFTKCKLFKSSLYPTFHLLEHNIF